MLKFILGSFFLIFSVVLSTVTAHAFDVDQLTESTKIRPFTQEKPFEIRVSLDEAGSFLVFHFKIQEGYHLYQDSIKIDTDPAFLLGSPDLPRGVSVTDPSGLPQILYHREVTFSAPLQKSVLSPFKMIIRYQGCQGKTFCLPPQSKNFSVDSLTHQIYEFQEIPKNEISDSSWMHTLFSFFGLGLFLAFSPCVLPMLPIIAQMLLGSSSRPTLAKQLIVSCAFVLGNAFIFTVLGLGAVFLGASLQAWIQTPLFIIPTIFLLVFMALSLLDYFSFSISLPTRLRISHQPSSSIHAFLLGLLSGFIFSPCISAPLVGILVLVTEAQNYIIGATSLFFLGLGMGLPLVATVIFGAHILPTRGPWMNHIKMLCAVLLLGLSIYLLSRIVSSTLVMILTAFLALGYGVSLLRMTHTRKKILRFCIHFMGILSLLYGGALLVGLYLGHRNVYHPLRALTASQSHLIWMNVSNSSTLEQELERAKKEGLPVIVDVYATWCRTCQYIEEEVIPDAQVQKKLSAFARIRLDLSQTDQATHEWLRAHHVFGPPAQLLFDREGRERTDQTRYGEITIPELVQTLQGVQN